MYYKKNLWLALLAAILFMEPLVGIPSVLAHNSLPPTQATPISQTTPTTTPLPTLTALPTLQASATSTPASTPQPTPSVISTPTPYPTSTPYPTITPTKKSAIRPNALASGDYILTATRIDGYDVRLDLSDFGAPTLTFSSLNINDMRLTHHAAFGTTLTLTASDVVTARGVAMKSGLFKDLGTALGSFTNPLDILTLLTGGTVRHLVMRDPTVDIDHFIKTNSITIPGLRVIVS